MFEYEVYFEETNEFMFLYGYNMADLAKRYPDIDPKSYKIVYKEYID